MASDRDMMEYIAGQIKDAGIVRYRRMFGEYAVYVNDKVVALVCDNQLFVKPTQAGKVYIGEPQEAPPYQGGKLWYLITDEVEDEVWLTELFRITAEHVPMSKPKRKKDSNG